MKSVFFFKEDHQHNLTFLEGSQTELLVMRGSNFRQGNSVLEKKKKKTRLVEIVERIQVFNCLKKLRKRIFYAVLQ